MVTVWNNISLFYSGWLYPTYTALINNLVHNQYSIYIILAVLIFLSIYKRVIKNKNIPKAIGLINFASTILIILLIIVAYQSFSPKFAGFFKIDSSKDSETGTTTPTKTKTKTTTPSTTTTPTQNPTTTYTAPKQLYYSVSCSSCWADACPRNGYLYNGYDSASYSFYYGLCQSCSCNSVVGHSFWK